MEVAYRIADRRRVRVGPHRPTLSLLLRLVLVALAQLIDVHAGGLTHAAPGRSRPHRTRPMQDDEPRTLTSASRRHVLHDRQSAARALARAACPDRLDGEQVEHAAHPGPRGRAALADGAVAAFEQALDQHELVPAAELDRLVADE